MAQANGNAANLSEQRQALANLNRLFGEVVSQLETVRPVETEIFASQVESLRTQLQERSRDMDDRFHQQQSELNSVTEERARLAATIQEREATIRTKDIRISTLEQQLRLATQQAGDLQLSLSDANARVDAAENRARSEKATNAELQRAIARLEDEVRRANENVTAEVALRVRAENELVSLREEMDKLTRFNDAQVKAYEEDIARLGRLVETANRDFSGQVHQQIHDALEAAQRGYAAEAEAVKNKYIRLYEEYIGAEEQRVARHNAALLEELSFLKGQLDAKNREVADLVARERTLSQRIAEWSQHIGGRVQIEPVEDVRAEITMYNSWLRQLQDLVASASDGTIISPTRRKRARRSLTLTGEDGTAWEMTAQGETAMFAGIDIRGANVELVNRSAAAINLDRWSLVVQLPSGDRRTLVFRRLNVASGERVRIGAGTNAGAVQFSAMDSFNQPPGTVLLLIDPSGTVAAEARRVEVRAQLLSPGAGAGAHLDS